jgi:WD40 repeat protein
MPEARLKREVPEPDNPAGIAGERPISADAVMNAFEQICLEVSASGAVVAMRDLEGVRCVVSFGNAPPVGSRLQSDSAFTRQCIETGEVVLCEDTEKDLRIQPAIATSLNLRSAVAVAIQAQGSVVGVIEVFCSQPSSIYPAAVARLRQVATLFAAVMIFESGHGGQPIVGGSPECPVVSPRPIMEQDATVEATGPEVAHDLEPSGSSGSEPGVLIRFARHTTPARLWLLGAAFVLFFVLLFLFMGFHNRRLQASIDGGIQSASERTRSGEAKGGPEDRRIQEKARAQDSNGSQPSFRTGALLPADSGPASKSDPLGRKIGAAVLSDQRAVPIDGKTIASSLSPGDKEVRGWTAPELKSPSRVTGKPVSGMPPSLLAEAPELKPPGLPADTAKADSLEGAPALALPIKPARVSPPDFVLERTLKGHSDWVTAVAFSSYGPLASGSWDQTVKFWDVLTGEELRSLRGKVKQVQALAFSRDGRWLAAENSANTVTIWDATTGNEVRKLPTDKPLRAVGTSWVYSIAFSPDGRWLASGVDDKTVRIWDTSTGQKVRDLTGSHRSVIYIAFSPDGRFLASGNDEKTIEIWEVSTGAEIQKLSGHRKPIFAVAFSPNGRWLASASGDKAIKLWDVATGHEIRTLTGHQNAVTSLAFSPDDRWLASGSWDKTIKLWDVSNGKELQTLGAHAHSIYTVAFDPRGQWLASGSEDGTVNIWRLSDAVNGPGLRTSP